MCDETAFKLLEQKVENIDTTVARSLVLLSESVDKSAKSLCAKIDRIEDKLEKRYATKGELEVSNVTTDANIDKLKDKVELLQKIVYTASGFILLAVLTAMVASVIR